MNRNPRESWRAALGAALLLSLGHICLNAQTLSPAQVNEDLDQFQVALAERWAHVKVGGVDYQATIRAIRARAAQGMTSDELGMSLMRVIALFRDGHAYVTGMKFPSGYLPFLIKPAGSKFVAFQSDRTDFLLKDFPYLIAVDGKPISEWRKIVEPLAPKGTPQYLTSLTLIDLQRIQFIRSVAGLPRRDEVEIKLASRDGKRARSLALKLAEQAPLAGRWPTTASRILESNIGYLRIPAMNAAAVETIQMWMPKFKETIGLVVDLRDNGGGSRAALRELFPYVMRDADVPVVTNASKYPLFREFQPSQLEDRFMYRENWSGWTPEERIAIERFKHDFKPEWRPPANEFSDWHYLVLSKRVNPAAYNYDRPVVILMNEECFSATDIFLSAFKGWRNVTLLGMPSSGGSSRVVSLTLKNSGLKVGLGSMVSFQRDGRFYDGHGIEPDIAVPPVPEYFLQQGQDNALERAIGVIRQRLRRRH